MDTNAKMDLTPLTEWEQSVECGELFTALAKAQADIEGAAKGKVNPAFRSKYADLASVWDACREPLTKNGLCVIQMPFSRGDQAGLRTQLGHSTGQWVACISFTTPKDNGPQALGSCLTYLRRYALSAFVGVCPEDDDGEKAEGRDRDAKPPGAQWGKQGSGPKAAAGSAAGTRATNATAPSTRPNITTTTASTSPTADTGEVLDAGQLVELSEAFEDKWGKGARTAAPSWLKAKFGTDNPAALTKAQATEALGALLDRAS